MNNAVFTCNSTLVSNSQGILPKRSQKNSQSQENKKIAERFRPVVMTWKLHPLHYNNMAG